MTLVFTADPKQRKIIAKLGGKIL